GNRSAVGIGRNSGECPPKICQTKPEYMLDRGDHQVLFARVVMKLGAAGDLRAFGYFGRSCASVSKLIEAFDRRIKQARTHSATALFLSASARRLGNRWRCRIHQK